MVKNNVISFSFPKTPFISKHRIEVSLEKLDNLINNYMLYCPLNASLQPPLYFFKHLKCEGKHIVFEREVDYTYNTKVTIAYWHSFASTFFPVNIVQPNLQLYNVLVHTLLIWVHFEDNIHILFYFICKNLWCKYAHFCVLYTGEKWPEAKACHILAWY